MVTLAAVHSMLIEMHGGMLTLATLSVLAIVLSSINRRFRGTSERQGFTGSFSSSLDKLATYAEPTAYLAAIGGVIFLVIAAIVGFYVWPIDVLMNSTLGLSKVMFSIFALELWVLFVVIRSRYGQGLWGNRGLATVGTLTALGGFFFMVLTGSFGGHMAGKGSVLDPVYSLLGVNPDALWVIGFDMVPILIGVAFVEIVAVFAVFLYYRRKT